MGLWKPALVMFAYAAAVLMIGIATAAAAPDGANTVTAIMVPGAIAVLSAVCGVLMLMMEKKRMLGMIGIHLGLVLPLLAVVGPVMRMGGSFEAAEKTNASITNIEQKLAEPESDSEVIQLVSGAVMQETLRSKGYQAVGLASTAALSGFAFVAMLVHRPKALKAVSEE